MAKTSDCKQILKRPDKTIDWLNKSRDEWKEKTQSSKAALKVAKQAQKRARAGREEWKRQSERLKVDHAKNKMELAQKDAEIARLKVAVVQLLRTSWAGFRLVSSLLKKLLVYGKIGQAPEAETLIQWELKIGLYKLERPKSTTEEWIWMADHVI